MIPLLTALSRLPGTERELRLLPLLLRPGRVAIDIGAALGVYAIPMALLVGATGAVLAFEPRPDAARRLDRLATGLRLACLQVHAAGLGARQGQAKLVIPRRRWSVGGRSFVVPGTGAHPLDDDLRPGVEIEVPITTLDHARSDLGRRVDFVKCDVEGAEHDVFSGGARVLQQDRPIVLCEIEARHTHRYGHTIDSVLSMFADHGYRPVRRPSEHAEPRNVLLVPAERRIPPGR